jgi:hypothetical protein
MFNTMKPTCGDLHNKVMYKACRLHGGGSKKCNV